MREQRYGLRMVVYAVVPARFARAHPGFAGAVFIQRAAARQAVFQLGPQHIRPIYRMKEADARDAIG